VSICVRLVPDPGGQSCSGRWARLAREKTEDGKKIPIYLHPDKDDLLAFADPHRRCLFEEARYGRGGVEWVSDPYRGGVARDVLAGDAACPGGSRQPLMEEGPWVSRGDLERQGRGAGARGRAATGGVHVSCLRQILFGGP
jgi:hypothetical protein